MENFELYRDHITLRPQEISNHPEIVRRRGIVGMKCDVRVIVTEHGLADLRALGPRKRSRLIVDRYTDPAYRPLLHDYLGRAEARPDAGDTPHILEDAIRFHARLTATGSMLG